MEVEEKGLRGALSQFKDRVGEYLLVLRAKSWNQIHWFQHYAMKFFIKHRTTLFLIILFVLVGLSSYLSFCFQDFLEKKLTNSISIDDFKTVLVTVGGALVGAGAISFSLVMFVLQVNIERMPHALFWKFSSDKKIIATFASILLLSLTITGLSLFVSETNILLMTQLAIWSVVIVIILVIYAYRRTLMLINPIKQLTRIVDDARAQFKVWEKRAERARPLFKLKDHEEDYLNDSSHDFALIQYFKINSHWTNEPKKGVDHAISYSRRYAEYGDYTVSGYALDVIVEINALYINAKGKTFFANTPFINNPLATDGFFNASLEHLRQNLSFAFSRKDEQQIEQTLQALRKLAFIYMDVDYSKENATKTHSTLAIGYLSDGIKSSLRHGFTDVVMEGLRLLGNIAFALVTVKSRHEIASIIEDIGVISAGSTINERNYPATSTGVEQLSKLTLILIKSEDLNVRFPLNEIRKNISLIAKTTLELSSPSSVSTHSSSLGPYYSGTSFESLLAQLTTLANTIINADENDTRAQQILGNIEQWADGIYQVEKELLLLSIQKKSHFTFDIINWITHISKLLLALSTAEVCDLRRQNKLKKHALWLFSTLTWIEDSPETISFVASYDIKEKFFEMVLEARNREALEFSIKVVEMLLNWAFKAGKYSNGWGILENSIYALITVSMMGDHDADGKKLMQGIKTKLKEKNVSKDLLHNTANHIRDKANHLYQLSSISTIERCMAQLDNDSLKSVLLEVADILEEEVESNE